MFKKNKTRQVLEDSISLLQTLTIEELNKKIKKQGEVMSRYAILFEFLLDEAGYTHMEVSPEDYRDNMHLYVGYRKLFTNGKGKEVLIIKKDKLIKRK